VSDRAQEIAERIGRELSELGWLKMTYEAEAVAVIAARFAAEIEPLVKRARLAVEAAPLMRRLTPRECERLQGFPDDWTLVPYKGKPMADGPRYRMLGNAVTVNVAEWIGRRILATDQLLPRRSPAIPPALSTPPESVLGCGGSLEPR
jgi:site-specific DNA-cytosine methylase